MNHVVFQFDLLKITEVHDFGGTFVHCMRLNVNERQDLIGKAGHWLLLLLRHSVADHGRVSVEYFWYLCIGHSLEPLWQIRLQVSVSLVNFRVEGDPHPVILRIDLEPDSFLK